MSSHPEKMSMMCVSVNGASSYGENGGRATRAVTPDTDARARGFDGLKDDGGKPRLSLVPPAAIVALSRVREYGVGKYRDPESWRLVSEERYVDACLRHILAYIDGEALAPDSGLPHLDHAMCNLAFLAALRAEGIPDKKEPGVKRQAI